jgi:hypothetical protein
MHNFFTTLGQLSAVIVSSSVVLPVYSYYSKNLIKFVKNVNSELQQELYNSIHEEFNETPILEKAD